MFQIKVAQKTRTHTLHSKNIFPKIVAFMR